MNKIHNYISELYQNNNIIDKKKFENYNEYKFYCPVIDSSTAGFLDMLIRIAKPKNVLELGTSIGYSGTIIANALKDYEGRVTTVELDNKVQKSAIKNFQRYGVEKYINSINGNAIEVIEKLNEKYDFIFIDLYNGLYLDVIDRCLEMLSPGGFLIADDTLFPVVRTNNVFEESNKKMQIFNKKIASDNSLYSYILPIDDGMTLIMKR